MRARRGTRFWAIIVFAAIFCALGIAYATYSGNLNMQTNLTIKAREFDVHLQSGSVKHYIESGAQVQIDEAMNILSLQGDFMSSRDIYFEVAFINDGRLPAVFDGVEVIKRQDAIGNDVAFLVGVGGVNNNERPYYLTFGNGCDQASGCEEKLPSSPIVLQPGEKGKVVFQLQDLQGYYSHNVPNLEEGASNFDYKLGLKFRECNPGECGV